MSSSSAPRRSRGAFPSPHRGWILQHVFFLTEAAARRYAHLGMRATTSLSFCWGKGDLFAERIGERVLADLIPLRRMLDAGLIVACGSRPVGGRPRCSAARKRLRPHFKELCPKGRFNHGLHGFHGSIRAGRALKRPRIRVIRGIRG
jgi:hypothetical protein